MDLDNIVKKLHDINFGENGLICLAEGDEYCVGRCKREDGIEHALSQNLEVDKHKNCQNCFCDVERMFTSVTHGTHTFDFLDAHGQCRTSVEGWSKVPVLFVMENPAYPDDSYKDIANGKRRVSKWWYWINRQSKEKNEKFFYPNYFVQKEYGWMIYSVIRTFKMANAYVTNMVKCGMKKKNGGDKSYLTTDDYPQKTVENCMGVLASELEALSGDGTRKIIVFAFGDRTYSRLKMEWLDAGGGNKQNVALYLLPHPANRLADDNRKYVLFGKILRALLQNGFYEGVTDKPNFEDILARDIDPQPSVSLEDFLISALKEQTAGNISKRKGYGGADDKKIGYEFTYKMGADGIITDEVATLALRQRIDKTVRLTAPESKEYHFKVSWVGYDFATDAISLYAGENADTSNILLDGKCDGSSVKVSDLSPENDNVYELFPIYGIMQNLVQSYKTKYENDNDYE